MLSIYPYHGGNRKKDPNFLAKFDIVVTTYGVVQVRQLTIFVIVTLTLLGLLLADGSCLCRACVFQLYE